MLGAGVGEMKEIELCRGVKGVKAVMGGQFFKGLIVYSYPFTPFTVFTPFTPFTLKKKEELKEKGNAKRNGLDVD